MLLDKSIKIVRYDWVAWNETDNMKDYITFSIEATTVFLTEIYIAVLNFPSNSSSNKEEPIVHCGGPKSKSIL